MALGADYEGVLRLKHLDPVSDELCLGSSGAAGVGEVGGVGGVGVLRFFWGARFDLRGFEGENFGGRMGSRRLEVGSQLTVRNIQK